MSKLTDPKVASVYMWVSINSINGVAKGAYKDIAKDTGMTIGVVRKSLSDLEALGAIEIFQSDRIGEPTTYKLKNEAVKITPEIAGISTVLDELKELKTRMGEILGIVGSLDQRLQGLEAVPRAGAPDNDNLLLVSNSTSYLEESNIYNKLQTKEKRKQEKKKESQSAKEILEYLSTRWERTFKSDSHLTPIEARLNDGHSTEDLKLVVDHKLSQWGKDKKMRTYLRPTTVFQASKFDGYLNDALEWKNQSVNYLESDNKWEKAYQFMNRRMSDMATSVIKCSDPYLAQTICELGDYHGIRNLMNKNAFELKTRFKLTYQRKQREGDLVTPEINAHLRDQAFTYEKTWETNYE